MSKPFKLDKRKLAGAAICGVCLLAPLPFAWQAIAPAFATPAQALYHRLPVEYRNLMPIRVRYRPVKAIPVRVIDQPRATIPVRHKDLSPIPITVKGGVAPRLQPLPGAGGVPVRHTRSSGIRPPGGPQRP